jgi:hypothetical protein
LVGIAARCGGYCAFRTPSRRSTLPASVKQGRGRVPRTLEAIQRDSSDNPALRGLVGVLHEKLQLRARYAFLEYESGTEGRGDISELYRSLSRLESEQIAQLGAALAHEWHSTDF